jgi:hypothetical protein
MGGFVSLVLSCAYEAMVNAERCVSGVFRPLVGSFPLFNEPSEFANFV